MQSRNLSWKAAFATVNNTDSQWSINGKSQLKKKKEKKKAQ